MPGFLFAASLLAAMASMLFTIFSSRQIGVLLVAAIAAAILGRYWQAGWLLNGLVFLSAVIAGVLVGRLVPARFLAMALFLGVVSALDIWWIGFADKTFVWLAPYANFSLEAGSTISSIGSFDLVLASAIATHWARRKATIFVSLGAAPVGMILSNLFVAVSGLTNLALAPFIAAGWLITQIWHRANQARQKS